MGKVVVGVGEGGGVGEAQGRVGHQSGHVSSGGSRRGEEGRPDW